MGFSSAIRPPRSWRDADTHYLKALQSEWYSLVLALQDGLTKSTVSFWSERGLRFGHLPLTTGSISSPMGLGSDSLPVSISLHGVQTFLADSMQFSLEYLCRLHPDGAYYLMPSFRGEQSDDTHLGQFYHSEAEIRGGLDDVLEIAESYVRRIVRDLIAEHEELIRQATNGDMSHVDQLFAKEKFSRLTLDQASELLHDAPDHIRVDKEGGWRTLTRAGERRLMDILGEFVWVTHWDELSVPFYQALGPDGRTSLNGDLLFGPGEVIGAGERHAHGDDVVQALSRHAVPRDRYEWYVAMKDTTPMQTAGFGLGVERLFMWLLRQDDIRDFQIFPRDNGRNIVP